MRVGRGIPSRWAPAAGDARATFALDVQYYLSQDPRQLPSRYLYDALGSCLFEAICRLPWYPITRAETRLLAAHAHEIFTASDPLARIVELGCGSGEKLATLVGGRPSVSTTLDLHLIDVSSTALAGSMRALDRLEGVRVVTHEASYEIGLSELRDHLNRGSAPDPGSGARGDPYAPLRSVAGAPCAPRTAIRRSQREQNSRAAPYSGPEPRGRTLLLFLGSNIGNFDPPGAHEFLREIRAGLSVGDLLLLGTDLVKPEPVLQLAYADPLGVTAAFNRNLLVRINRELGGDFDLSAFAHRAIWNERESRIEMHLVSRRPHAVRVQAAGLDIRLGAGESIWTESSYKYEAAAVASLAEPVGFRRAAQWIDAGDQFALTLFEAS